MNRLRIVGLLMLSLLLTMSSCKDDEVTPEESSTPIDNETNNEVEEVVIPEDAAFFSGKLDGSDTTIFDNETTYISARSRSTSFSDISVPTRYSYSSGVLTPDGWQGMSIEVGTAESFGRDGASAEAFQGIFNTGAGVLNSSSNNGLSITVWEGDTFYSIDDDKLTSDDNVTITKVTQLGPESVILEGTINVTLYEYEDKEIRLEDVDFRLRFSN